MNDNVIGGKQLYLEDDPSREWFHAQWKYWPERVDERYTTNASFLYGGILAYREINNCEPEISEYYSSCVEWMDKHNG